MSLIFLSHVEEDAPLMRAIAQGLEDAGYPTWYFERDQAIGASYLLQIARVIEGCDAVVLAVSPPALSSGQVTREVISAFEKGLPFFPILMDVTPEELKKRQPEWKYALGGTGMATLGTEGLAPIISGIVEGLEAGGIEPGSPAAFAPVLSTPAAAAPAGAAARILAERSGLEGERKQITVLSAEVTGLSSLDPEERHELSGLLTDLISERVHYYEGTVANLSADGFTAFFGAPIAHEDDPARALHAALSIREYLEARPEGLSLRAGANTGLVIVGAIGDDLAMEYTAIGDTVTLASCLRDVSKPGVILAPEDTYRLTQGYFDFAQAAGIEEEGKPIRTYQVLAPTSADTRVEASLSKGLSHFVGREKELAHLTECLEKAAEGQGQVLGVVGEPGVGKSRLIHEFTTSLPAGEYALLQSGCHHYGDAIPYLPILGMLKDYFDIGEADDEATVKKKIKEHIASFNGRLDDTVSPLQEIFSLQVEDQAYLALELQQRRTRVFEAVRLLLIAESQKRPLVIVVEDLHWIDKTSEEFFAYLIDSLAGTSILLILLFRPEYKPAWADKTYFSQLRVDQLPKKTSEELVSSILSKGKVDPQITRLITSRASGNPLFIEELTHGLLENGSIKKEKDLYTLAGKPSDIEVPDTIQGIIAARLDRLEENLKRIMQVASVIGREFAFRILAAITELSEELKSYLASLQGLEFIYEKSLFPELEYIFKHALTQEVAYNSLLRKKRRELHGSIGQTIEALYPERLEEYYEMLAYHYVRSDDTDKALTYLKLSGDKAARNYSNWEAVGFYKEAIKILDSLPESDARNQEKIEVCFSIWNPMIYLNYPEGSLEILQEAERLARELDDGKSLIRAYRRLANYHTMSGNTSLGIEYAEKCFDEAEKIGASDSMVRSASSVGLTYFAAGDISKVADITLRALRIIDEQHREKDVFTGGINVYSTLCGYCGMAMGYLGRFEEGRDVLGKGLAIARETNDLFGMGFIETCHFPVCAWGGDGHGSVAHARKAIEYIERTGIELLLGWAWSFLSYGYYLLGEYETARDYGEKALEVQKKSGPVYSLPAPYWVLASIYLDERARRHAEEAVRLSREFESRLWEAQTLMELGRVEASPSQIDVAEQHLRQGISLADELRFKPASAIGYLYLGGIFELAGRREEAIENLRIAEKMGQEMGMGYWLTRTQEALARLEGGA